MITVSIDPVTKQVAMFSLPRDTSTCRAARPAQRVWGTTYGQKINSFFTATTPRRTSGPGTDETRGYNALKAILGNLYSLDIKYFVEVNFNGFRKVVDALGGVTINVQVPVVDDTFPGDDRPDRSGCTSRAGIQHMDGAQALRYARSRHTSTDFDRGARQQRVLLSLREQADSPGADPELPELVAALKSAVRTDIPLDQLRKLLGLAAHGRHGEHPLVRVRAAALRTQTCLSARLHVLPERRQDPARGRRTRSRSIRSSRRTRQALAGEEAQIWVLNGTGETGRASRLAAYLEYHGLAASAPRQKPAGTCPATTVVVYNGAESEAAGDDRLPAELVRGRRSRGRRPGHPRRRRRSRSARTPTSAAARSRRLARAAARGLAGRSGRFDRREPVLVCRAAGRGPPRSSGPGRAGRSGRPRPNRRADGRPRSTGDIWTPVPHTKISSAT